MWREESSEGSAGAEGEAGINGEFAEDAESAERFWTGFSTLHFESRSVVLSSVRTPSPRRCSPRGQGDTHSCCAEILSDEVIPVHEFGVGFEGGRLKFCAT